MVESTIHIAIAASLAEGLSLLALPSLDDLTLLPSSLQRKDHAASELREHLRQRGLQTHLLLPEPIVTTVLNRARNGWSQLALPPSADLRPATVALPTKLVETPEVWSVIDTDAVSGRGPYALDLLGRYTDPRTRLRLVGSRHRADMAVAILAARPLQRHIIVRHAFAFELVATTTDPIAAELLALSLVDEDLTRDHQVAGPWEDELVQRATERDLGARLPQEISITLVGPSDGPASSMLSRVLGRMGVAICS